MKSSSPTRAQRVGFSFFINCRSLRERRYARDDKPQTAFSETPCLPAYVVIKIRLEL